MLNRISISFPWSLFQVCHYRGLKYPFRTCHTALEQCCLGFLAHPAAWGTRFWKLLTRVRHRFGRVLYMRIVKRLTVEGLAYSWGMSFLMPGRESGTIVQKAGYVVTDTLDGEIRTFLQQCAVYRLPSIRVQAALSPDVRWLDVSYGDGFH
jgi:hypothetical protein